MSRTDKTRPWWVQMADAPGSTCMPVHDHRWGPCTLPAGIGAARTGGCHWAPTPAQRVRRWESHGYREWNFIRRQERRRDRHEARRGLRAGNGADAR